MEKRPTHLRCLGHAQILSVFLWGILWPQADVRELPPPTPSPGKPSAGVGTAGSPGGIVAIVGSDVITQAELDKRVQQRRAQLAEIYPASILESELARLSWITLERMIENTLVLQLVKKEEEKSGGKAYASDVEVDRAIERQLELYSDKNPMIRTADDLYRMVSQTQGFSREEYRKFIKEQIAIDIYLRQNVLKFVDSFVSPEAARLYYKTHMDEFTDPVEISFRYILIRLGREDTYARRLAVEKGIKAEQPFLELARKFSEEAMQGDVEAAGRLWKKSFEELKSWYTPIPEVLKKLKKGRVSEGILTARGLQYFLAEDVVEGKPRTFSEAQEEIRKKIRDSREEAQLDDFMKQLRKKTYTRNFLPSPEEETKGKGDGRGKEESGEKKGVGSKQETQGKEEPGSRQETQGKGEGKETRTEEAGGTHKEAP